MEHTIFRGLKPTFYIFLLFLLTACGSDNDFSPKPRGFYRVVLPEKTYREYNDGCPFTFEYPVYASVTADKDRGAKPCWLNMDFASLNGTLHLSYNAIQSKKEFNQLIEDARTFAFKHTVKATAINEGTIRYPDRRVYGIYYTIEGNAASSAQFFLTDSTRHYLRGALYFNSEPRLDSLRPVLDFVKQDMDVMIKTFKWK